MNNYFYWKKILIVMSFICSILSFLFGLYLAVNGIPLVFVMLPVCYAIAASIILINALRTGKIGYSRVAFYFAFALSLLLIIGSIDKGRISSLEWFLIGVVVPVLNLNWIATKFAVGYRRNEKALKRRARGGPGEGSGSNLE